VSLKRAPLIRSPFPLPSLRAHPAESAHL
jgi:hypothetical protein